jgi:hypothetical protein
MNEPEITAILKANGLNWSSFAEWIEGEPRPENGAYYPNDVNRFIYWQKRQKQKQDEIRNR